MKVFIAIISVCLLVVCCTAQEDRRQDDRRQDDRRQDERRPQQEERRVTQEPRETSTWIPILKYNKEQSEDGSYKTQYETGNNIIHEESGYLKDFSDDHPNGVLVQHGQYSYESPDGQIVNVHYTADENGFHATGDHIPTPPPVPEEIQKGLDQIYAGIEQQKKALEERARNDPAFAKKLEERRLANQNGQYIGILEN